MHALNQPRPGAIHRSNTSAGCSRPPECWLVGQLGHEVLRTVPPPDLVKDRCVELVVRHVRLGLHDPSRARLRSPDR